MREYGLTFSDGKCSCDNYSHKPIIIIIIWILQPILYTLSKSSYSIHLPKLQRPIFHFTISSHLIFILPKRTFSLLGFVPALSIIVYIWILHRSLHFLMIVKILYTKRYLISSCLFSIIIILQLYYHIYWSNNLPKVIRDIFISSTNNFFLLVFLSGQVSNPYNFTDRIKLVYK